MDKIGTIIGFDFGMVRIGVAIGQMITSSANPLCVLNSNGGVPNWQEVTDIFNEWQPDAIVVGLPIHMDGESQDLTKSAKRFAQRLEGRYNKKTYTVDERLTSYEAEQLLSEQPLSQKKSGKKGKRSSKGEVDMLAAKIILQSWMDQYQISNGGS